MKEELRIFFTALMFYTRIPCPKNIDHSPEYINKATRYFPLVGSIVGALSFLVFWLSALWFDTNTAILFSLMAGILITGAFHEDGLADTFDGFGGGWSKARILEIMKDSRIGTYGVIALIFLFALKYLAFRQLLLLTEKTELTHIACLFVSYHTLARFSAVNLVFTSQYSREDESSKARPIARAHGYREIMGAYFFGLLPLMAICLFHLKYALVLIPLLLLVLFSKKYFEKWIHGYTGDCLGAVEQLAECIILLSYVVLWKFM